MRKRKENKIIVGKGERRGRRGVSGRADRGSAGGLAKDHTFPQFFFLNPSLSRLGLAEPLQGYICMKAPKALQRLGL